MRVLGGKEKKKGFKGYQLFRVRTVGGREKRIRQGASVRKRASVA